MASPLGLEHEDEGGVLVDQHAFERVHNESELVHDTSPLACWLGAPLSDSFTAPPTQPCCSTTARRVRGQQWLLSRYEAGSDPSQLPRTPRRLLPPAHPARNRPPAPRLPAGRQAFRFPSNASLVPTLPSRSMRACRAVRVESRQRRARHHGPASGAKPGSAWPPPQPGAASVGFSPSRAPYLRSLRTRLATIRSRPARPPFPPKNPSVAP